MRYFLWRALVGWMCTILVGCVFATLWILIDMLCRALQTDLITVLGGLVLFLGITWIMFLLGSIVVAWVGE